jgi:ornithine cyclodeaminase
MSIRFRLLTEADVKAVLTMDDLIDTMASALRRFSTGSVVQPVRSIVGIDEHAFFGVMPAYVHPERHDTTVSGAKAHGALGAKLVTLFERNTAAGLPTHLASIVLLDPETGALRALLDGRFITESRTAAVSAVTSRLLARKTAASLAIIGSGVQARSHLDALSRIHRLRHVSVWSPTKTHRDRFVADVALGADAQPFTIKAVDHPGEAVVGADLIVLATSSPAPVIENGWVKPGAHVMSVGACRPTQREMDPALVARARLFVDSRAAAVVESGDVVLGIREGRFAEDHIVAEIGELLAGMDTGDGAAEAAPYGAAESETKSGAEGRRTATEVTIFKSLGLAVEDVTAADLAYRRAVERGIGMELTL